MCTQLDHHTIECHNSGPHARTDVYEYLLLPIYMTKWNDLPSTTKDLQSLDTFGKSIPT